VPESNQNEIVARLRKLPRQLLLALINGTAILVIIAAILALVAFIRLEHLAENIATTMTSAVLARVDTNPREARAKLEGLASEIRDLKDTIRSAATGKDTQLNSDLGRLGQKLDDLRGSIDRLVDAKGLLTDEAMSRIGRSITNALEELKACSPGAS
jgi:uncharacterized protein YlxW (UPF0749 family)